jgi:protein gp37
MFWFGQTATTEDEYQWWSKGLNKFVSIEPIMENFDFADSLDGWVIIGAETGNRKGNIIPRKWWLKDIVESCKITNTPVFMKNSLAAVWGAPLIQEFPWR